MKIHYVTILQTQPVLNNLQKIDANNETHILDNKRIDI